MASTYFFNYISHFYHIGILCSGQIMALSVSQRRTFFFPTAVPSFMPTLSPGVVFSVQILPGVQSNLSFSL